MLASKATAAALSGALLFGVLTFASAVPQKKAAKKATGAPAASVAEGKKVYNAQGCAACHVIGDKGGKTGPELTHIGKTKKAPQIELAIRDPKKADPKSTMPPYGTDKIDAKGLKNLVGYLLSLK